VPITLVGLWWGYLPCHGWKGTAYLVLLSGVSTLLGRRRFYLARATLRGERTIAKHDAKRSSRSLFGRVVKPLCALRPDKVTLGLTLLLTAVLVACSGIAFFRDPRADWDAKFLNAVYVRTYANLREVEVAQRPEGWDGKDWSKVKRVDLHGRNLAFADLTRTFLVNADLRGAILTDAVLDGAELRGADFFDKDRQLGAQLQAASLKGAQLQGAVLHSTELQGADLEQAQLQGSKLFRADLQGADLINVELQSADLQQAQLQGADLSGAHLQDSDLSDAQLQGAVLHEANLQAADLRFAHLQGAQLNFAKLQGAILADAQLQAASLQSAQLQGAFLGGAQLQGAVVRSAQLEGAVLSGAALWRAWVDDAAWDLADLRGFNVQPMAKTEVDAVTASVSAAIADHTGRKEIAEQLQALSDDNWAEPEFPDEWRSQPTVMFEPYDPKPKGFDWGPRKWATEHAYDQDLAKILGELACSSNVSEAQTRALARRALFTAGLLPDMLQFAEQNRVWPQQFAARLTHSDCPPAKGLPEGMRRSLEKLAARSGAP
jgi:uncharacterized protein YjbI with pentapeptide repeats